MATDLDIAAKQSAPTQEDAAPVVAVENVFKSFDGHKVLNGINLRVNKGETLAVLGRSGTGKSVLLRLIIGLTQPDTGSICIHGQDMAGLALDGMSEIRKRMGFLFQHAALYDSLTVAGNVAFPLEHHRRDMSRSEQSDRVRQLLAEVGLEGDLEKMPSDISGGMQKRVGLARALALEPEILLLDEPTAGLDPKQINETRDLIKSFAGDHTIILSTHILPEVEQTCEQVIIINKGKLVATDSVRNLRASARDAESLLLEIGGRDGDLEASLVQQRLEQVPGVSRVLSKDQSDRGRVFEVESQRGRLVRGDLARAIVASGWDLNELRPAARSLEEVFLQLTGGQAAVEAGETAAEEPRR